MAGGRIKYSELATIMLQIVLISLVLVDSAHTEESDIIFEADHQRRIRDNNVIVLTGNVYVNFQDYDFYADEVRLDEEKKEIFGIGNVKIEGQDRLINADSFWYNYDRDDFEATKANGMIMVGGVGEPVYFVCQKIKGNINNYKLISTTMTTCEPGESQEYHIEAKSVKVMPDNKVILRNALFYFGKIPIFYFPYYVYSLKETPFELQVGKNRTEGTYVKVRYNYLYEENIMGSLVYHYLSRLGMRFGADYKYYIDGQGEGAFNITYLKTKKSAGGGSDISLNTRQKFRFSPQFSGDVSIRQDRDVDVVSGATRNNFQSRISLTDRTPTTNSSFNYSYNSQKGNASSSSATSQLTHRRDWKKRNLSFDTNFNYNRNNTSTEDKNGSLVDDTELQARMDLSKRKDMYDWKFKLEKRFDIDGKRYAGDENRTYFDRLPEITLSLNPEFFSSKKEREGYGEGRPGDGFVMRNLEFIGALYYQGPKDDEIQGFFGKFKTDINRDFPVSESARFTTSCGYLQNISSTGDALYSFSPQIGFRKDFSKKLKMDMNWRKSESNGRSPFRQESGLGSNNNASWNLNLNDKKWSHRWSTGYNVKGSRWQNLNYNMTYKSGQKFRYNLSTSYALKGGDWSPLNNSITLTNSKTYTTDFSLVYNLQDNKLTSFSNNTKMILGPNWDLEFQLQHSHGSDDSFPYLKTIYLNKRLDCTFFQISYESSNDALMFAYGITAYPALSYAYRNNDQGMRNTLPGFGSGGFDFGGDTFGGGGSSGGGGYYGGGGSYGGGGGGYYGGGDTW